MGGAKVVDHGKAIHIFMKTVGVGFTPDGADIQPAASRQALPKEPRYFLFLV
jgi:hypothetical protein